VLTVTAGKIPDSTALSPDSPAGLRGGASQPRMRRLILIKADRQQMRFSGSAPVNSEWGPLSEFASAARQHCDQGINPFKIP